MFVALGVISWIVLASKEVIHEIKRSTRKDAQSESTKEHTSSNRARRLQKMPGHSPAASLVTHYRVSRYCRFCVSTESVRFLIRTGDSTFGVESLPLISGPCATKVTGTLS